MSAIRTAPITRQPTRTLDDAPQAAMRGIVFGLLFSAALWFLIVLVFIALT